MDLVPSEDRWIGAAFVIAAVLFQVLWLGLPAVFLSLALVVSYALWIGSGWRATPRLQRVFVLAVVIFLAHGTEEFSTGFQRTLPELFGRAGWSDRQYLVFNFAWALVFVGAAFSIRPRRHFPILIVLFFAVAGGVGNGALHLLVVLRRGEYFPGAWTAPFCLGVGIWLLWLLYGYKDNGRKGVRDENP